VASARKLIGEIMVALSYVSIEQINEARMAQMQGSAKLLGEYLRDMGYVDQGQVDQALAIQNLD